MKKSCKHGVLLNFECTHCNRELFLLLDDDEGYDFSNEDDDDDFNMVDIEQY